MLYDTYETPAEFNLNRAVENIKLAQQSHKRELEKKDEAIKSLNKRIEILQFESRDFTDFKRLSEKENRELLSANQALRHELSLEQAENQRLKDEISRMRSDLSAQADKIAHCEAEHEKANHIIKNLLKKFQVKPVVAPRTV